MARLCRIILLALIGTCVGCAGATSSQTADPQKLAPEELTPTRGELSLAGEWAFLPVGGGAEQGAPESGWGEILVPANWAAKDAEVQPGQHKNWSQWKEKGGRHFATAWYRKSVEVPADWQGRSIQLDLGRVSTDAKVYVDGKLAGSVGWPNGRLDLTNHLTPGRTAQLMIFVAATLDKKTLVRMMGDAPDQAWQEEAKLQTRGITGPITLRSFPKGAHIVHVAIMPSVRNRQLTLDIALTDLPKEERLKVTAMLLDEAGTVEKTFSKQAEASAGNPTVTVSWPWSEPRLWDVGQPNLYTLRLEVKGKRIQDFFVDRFGFREFWIEGKDYYLNGRPFRARPATAGFNSAPDMTVREMIAEHQKLGFNMIEIWPNSPWADRSSASKQASERWFELSDEMGMPITGVMPHVGWKGERTTNPERFAQMKRWAREALERYGNHPSIVMWGGSGNLTGSELHPQNIGHKARARRHYESLHDDAATTARRLQPWLDFLHELDPTRPAFFHNAGHLGDAFTTNFYMNMIPLQEREEWLSEYAENGTMPLWYVEFGMPHQVTMFRARANYPKMTECEPWLSEFTAAYFGNRAYELETDDYRRRIVEKFKQDQEYRTWHLDPVIQFSPSFQELIGLFTENTWRSWRTWGNSGGMNPWTGDFKTPDGKMSALGRAMLENNQATLAWISGPENLGHTDKTRHYRDGASVTKRVAVLNDSSKAQPYRVQWKAEIAGKRVAEGESDGTIDAGTTAFAPIHFELPGKSTKKQDGVIEMQATIGSQRHTDRLAFRTYPKLAPIQTQVAIADATGKTRRMLESLGVRLRAWSGNPTESLVVVGREHEHLTTPGFGEQLEAHVKAGGKALVFVQQPDALRDRFSLRINRHQSRQVFVLDPAHPVASGLDNFDLKDWTGTTTMLEPYPSYGPKEREETSGKPRWGWRWGNRHVVSSGLIEKPHLTGWTPLFEADFDLAYTPLMELDYGKGRIIFNQFDFEDQYRADPAAALLLSKLLKYAQTVEPKPRLSTVYLGSADGKKVLDELGLIYRRAWALPGGPGPTLAIVEPGAISEAQLQKFLERGNQALLLTHRSAEAPFGVRLAEKQKFLGATEVKKRDQVTRGLSGSDLRYRNYHRTWVLESGLDAIHGNGQLGTKRIGSGLLVYSQLDPNRFDADEKTYFRFTRWRQTRALAQVLTNLGAAFEEDSRLFNPEVEEDGAKEDQPVNVSLSGPWQLKVTKRLTPAPSVEHAYPDPGISKAAKPLLAKDVSTKGWQTAPMPKMIEHLGEDWSIDGEFVLRKTFEVPEALVGKAVKLSLGAIDDIDATYVNGRRVGGVSEKGYAVDRVYDIPAGLLQAGSNVIAIRVWDKFGGGGINTTHDKFWIGEPPPPPEPAPVSPLYHPDYIHPDDNYTLSDEPYRYYNY